MVLATSTLSAKVVRPGYLLCTKSTEEQRKRHAPALGAWHMCVNASDFWAEQKAFIRRKTTSLHGSIGQSQSGYRKLTELTPGDPRGNECGGGPGSHYRIHMLTPQYESGLSGPFATSSSEILQAM